MAHYKKPVGFEYTGLSSLVPGVVLMVQADPTSDIEEQVVMKVSEDINGATLSLQSSVGRRNHIALIMTPHSSRFRINRNPDNPRWMFDVIHGSGYRFLRFADYTLTLELQDGIYTPPDDQHAVKIGDKIYLGKKGVVTTENYESPSSPEHVKYAGWKKLAHRTSSAIPDNVLSGGVFVAVHLASNTMSLHRRRDHGIEPLEGFTRLRVSDIKSGYAIYPFTQNKDHTVIKEGSVLTTTNRTSGYADRESRVLKVHGDRAIVCLVPENHVPGKIIPALVCRLMRAPETSEFTVDQLTLRLARYQTHSKLPERLEHKVPLADYKVAMETIGHGISVDMGNTANSEDTVSMTSLGLEKADLDIFTSSDCATYVLTHRYIRANSDRTEEQEQRYIVVDGNMYCAELNEVSLTVDSPPQPIPELHNGDLYRDYIGGYGMFWDGCSISLARRNGIVDEEIFEDGLGRQGQLLVDSNSRYTYLDNERTRYSYPMIRRYLPAALAARRGEWCLDGRVIRYPMQPGNQSLCFWASSGVELPIHLESWHTESSMPVQAHVLRTHECPVCRTRVSRNSCHEVVTLRSGQRENVCRSCVENTRIVQPCTSCSRLTHVSAMSSSGECPSCARSSLTDVIRSHSYRPRPIFHGEGPLFMGTEIELEASHGYERAVIAKTALEGREKFLYAKSDGSLNNGIEFVSHPFTVDWLQNNTEVFKSFFDVVRGKYGMQSNSTCGIHIHTSKAGYAVKPESIPGCQDKTVTTERLIARGLLRAQKFVYGHTALMVHFAGRTNDRYASLKVGPHSNSRVDEMLHLSKALSHGKDCRYTGLNVTEKTLEYRIFRSTTDLDELLRDLMFVDSIVQFIRSVPVPKTGAPSLKKYREHLASDSKYAKVLEHFDAWAASAKYDEKQVNFYSREPKKAADQPILIVDDPFTPRTGNFMSQGEIDAITASARRTLRTSSAGL